MLWMENPTSAPTDPFMLVITEATQVLPSACSAHILTVLLFLFCMCYFKLEHNASIFRLLLNATAIELRTRQFCRAVQNNIPTDETSHAARLPHPWDVASISGSMMRGEPVAVVQACLPGRPTSQKPFAVLPLLGDTSKAPCGSRDHSTALLVFKFPEMGGLDPGWSLLAGKASVGFAQTTFVLFSLLP